MGAPAECIIEVKYPHAYSRCKHIQKPLFSGHMNKAKEIWEGI